jgi:hypothetical protein
MQRVATRLGEGVQPVEQIEIGVGEVGLNVRAAFAARAGGRRLAAPVLAGEKAAGYSS